MPRAVVERTTDDDDMPGTLSSAANLVRIGLDVLKVSVQMGVKIDDILTTETEIRVRNIHCKPYESE